MLFGTEGGKIEHWVIETAQCQKIYDVHPESDAGVSRIIELKTRSALLRGEQLAEGQTSNFKLIATASSGSRFFCLWKFDMHTMTLNPYQRIETTITDGIKYLVETQETQLVAANERVLKFYDFLDKKRMSEIEQEKKKQEEILENMKEIFNGM